MPAVYPTAVKSFSPKVDNIDIVFAEHVNTLQDEVTAVEGVVGKNPHQFPGIVVDANSAPPVPKIGQKMNYANVAQRLDLLENQATWLTKKAQKPVDVVKPFVPPAAVIIAPGINVPAGEGDWKAYVWGAADFDPYHMYQGGTTIACPVTGFWDVSVNVWADSTTRRANDLHFVHTRLIRDYNEVAGQDSMIETMTWIRHRINMSWQGRWYAGSTLRVDVSQHGASDNTVDSNCVISLAFVREL